MNELIKAYKKARTTFAWYLSHIVVKQSPYEMETNPNNRLTIRVMSFSFKHGLPTDPSGNGGGYIFDCRSTHNPGRYEAYKHLTGHDAAVIKFLEDDGEITTFLSHVFPLIDHHTECFLQRGFTHLMVCFGCTGGQHRSVYCAEQTARHLKEKYPVRVVLEHREQSLPTMTFN